MNNKKDIVAIAGRYTVTFAYDGDFDLPDNPSECRRKTPLMVRRALESGLFEIVDFNLAGHYDEENAQTYIQNSKLHRAVVEISLLLTLQDIMSREAIFQKCLTRFNEGDLEMTEATENDNPGKGILQSIIRFEEI